MIITLQSLQASQTSEITPLEWSRNDLRFPMLPFFAAMHTRFTLVVVLLDSFSTY